VDKLDFTFGGMKMGNKRIKWGNVIMFLLIISAAVAAIIYKNPGTVDNIFNSGSKKQQVDKGLDKNNGSGIDIYDYEGTAKEDDKAPSGDEFVMGLDSWIGGTPALMGLGRGYNNDYSLNLKLKYIPNDGDRIVALKNGIINATEMSLPAFIRFKEKYPDSAVIVGITDFSRGADGIVAKSDVKNLNDMEGRKVSYVSDGTGKFILNKFLRLTGLRYQDIEPIERKEMSDVVDDLKSGKADLIVSWSPDMNIAIKEINAEKPNTVKMLINTKEVPNLVPTVLVVNKKTLENNPDRVEAFLKTWYASVKYIVEKPDKAYEKLAQMMSEREEDYGEVTKKDVKESFSSIKLMTLNDNFSYFGLNGKEEMFTPIINDTAQTWKKYGDMAASTVIPDNIVNSTFIKKLRDSKDDELLVGVLDSSLTGNTSQDDETQKDFKKQDETSVDINTEKVAKVDIPPVYYDTGKATVKKESLAVLNEVVNILKQFPTYYLIIDAHTDTVGSDAENLKLSRDRADTVKKYLETQGINSNRLVARGFGESKPIVAGEKTEADRAKNRRTEFTLTREATTK
jgi:outer membrane protein OmpA-like peptidoglycan-associated protein/ABC-type nitrate/sulfonate/bicarbonate transport system substrate-binding protein